MFHCLINPISRALKYVMPVVLVTTSIIMASPTPGQGAARQNHPAPTTHLLYEAYWGGLHVADLTLSMENGGDVFQNRFKLETRGITKFFSNLSVVASSKGHLATPPANGEAVTGARNNAAAGQAGPAYLPTIYRTDYSNSKHFRWVEILFPYALDKVDEKKSDPATPAIATTGTSPLPGKPEKWNPKDKGPEKLEKVDDKMLHGVVDPITALVQSLSGVRAHLQGGPDHFSIKGFDGRRRFDFDVQYLGLATRTVRNKKHDTYHMRITPRPIAGFKKRHLVFWTGAAFDFYLSRDGNMAPVQIVPLKHGPIFNLISVCNVPCKMPPEE